MRSPPWLKTRHATMRAIGAAFLLLFAARGAAQTADSENVIVIEPDGDVSSFGKSLALVPDVNLDGRQDIAIGGNTEDGGAVFIYDGASFELLTVLTPPNPGINLFFGREIAGISDLNNNGAGDVVVTTSEVDEERVYVFDGASGTLDWYTAL